MQSQRTRCLYVLLYILRLFVRHIDAAINWKLVKPMYLVSMYPPPFGMNAGNRTASMEPMVMNLETPTLDVDMLPVFDHAMERIFGGSIGHPNNFPYQVGMLLQRPKGLYWCGGSLISDEYVLTAAHCVDMAKRALIFLGAHQIKNAKEDGQVRLMVNSSNFVIFPTWNPRRLKDDIAVIRLPAPIEFTERIQPIQLPKRSYEHRSFRDKLAIASGWGRYATGVHAISNDLRYVNLRIVNGKSCKKNFPLSFRSTNICTSGSGGRSTCSGDSGGPLVLRRRNSKKRVLIGITSFGSIFGCDRGYPAAFTKVASYLDWINDETGIQPSAESELSNAMLFDDYSTDDDDDEAENIDSSVKPKYKPSKDKPKKDSAKKKPKNDEMIVYIRSTKGPKKAHQKSHHYRYGMHSIKSTSQRQSRHPDADAKRLHGMAKKPRKIMRAASYKIFVFS